MIIKKCLHCKKIIWFWQSRFLGSAPAHKKCDMLKFEESLMELVKKGLFHKSEAEYQLMMRDSAYS